MRQFTPRSGGSGVGLGGNVHFYPHRRCVAFYRNLIDPDAILSVGVGTGLVQFEADERRVDEGSKVVVVKTTAVVCKIRAENGVGELRDPFLSEAVKCPLPYTIRGIGLLWFSVDFALAYSRSLSPVIWR